MLIMTASKREQTYTHMRADAHTNFPNAFTLFFPASSVGHKFIPSVVGTSLMIYQDIFIIFVL